MGKREILVATLRTIANQFPPEMIDEQVRDIPRMAFNIGLGLARLEPKPPSELEICDLGGGVGLFSVGCAAHGFKRTVLVDDFNDPVNFRIGSSILDLHRSHGVEVVSRDVVEKGIRDLEGKFDIISSFDSMEHWHQSPKRLFHDAVEKLKPSGVFVLATPNCVDLKKRIGVPLGHGRWSRVEDWYEAEKFRGHVREPDIRDLAYIASDLGLDDVKILGRNWLNIYTASPVVRLAATFMDHSLRLRPSMCGTIYLIGTKA